jgi:NAD(P)-dependent dehydrogenase (short-subunit alcohol dehydrogenase family)
MQLENKVALITGAASDRSIGWGIAKALADEGAAVILNDLPDQKTELEARAAELNASGGKAIVAAADITQPEQVTQMFATAEAEFGQLDIVVSNAGIIRWAHVLELTPAIIQSIVAVNIKGNMMVCQAAARQMIAHGQGGRIIITSSVQADMHFPITPVYGGTKHAMHIFVGALALELAPYNITVNHIGPGWCQTGLNDPAPDQQTEEDIVNQQAAIPLRRAGTIEEMGQAAVYFASPAAAYMTGAFLRIDGGLGISKYSY